MSIDVNINEKKAASVISRGILGAVKWIAAWYALAMVAIAGALYSMGGDSTDGATRSNMKLHTDAMTGCQYLSVAGGGITPRLSASGAHICDRPQ
jgi:hypothetical protein